MNDLPSGARQGLRVSDIAHKLGGALLGNGNITVARVASLNKAGPGDVAFLSQPGNAHLLRQSKADCVIVPTGLEDQASAFPAAIVTADPYLYYARLAQWFAALQEGPPAPGVHPAAVVHPQSLVAPSASIEACAVIERGAVIGEGARVGAGCFVGQDAVIGAATRLHPRCVVLHDCTLGSRCIVHSGAVIGADGFGFARDEQGAGVKIPQTGRVVIGDDVEIGANTTVDRGALDDTRIGDGVKIDNLVQVAHNVQIGAHTAVAGCVGISGSASIGSYCFIGGGVGIAGHLDIADHVVVGGMSLVSRSIRQPGHYTGAFPLDSHENWTENAASLRHLAQLRHRVRQLENMLNAPKLPPKSKP
ncbi:MAG: UDP-3-O-(3-hydroxymyristoyl)glucosamine N-acyltransferase [Proteobacteria bacterium]|nr:UDP-3-O-(3-hydroxymyristoyl)glucosamine N-acyltransferase [Pseudomonadota bacterium]